MTSSQESRTTPDISSYVGIPYSTNGCYRLVRDFYREQLGILLSEDNLFVAEDSWGSAVENAKPEWSQLEEPGLYDVVLMFLGKNDDVPQHIGIYIGGGKVLHTREKTGSVIEPLAALRRLGIVEGYYRHVGRID